MSMTERAFQRDRAVVLGSIGAVAAIAWLYLIGLGSSPGMSGMAMSDMMMEPEMTMPWRVRDFLLVLLMWTAMMVGMMLPSASPMVLIYARVARQAKENQKPFAATGWFAGGYVLSWIGFSVLATAAQWVLEQAAVLAPTSLTVDRTVGGIVLIAAGLYQWSPFKNACLTQCQAPLSFIQQHGGFRRDPGGAVTLGFRHGLYCVGCCWVLMALLFVVGVMNLLWIAALSIFVLLEKIIPTGTYIPRVSGTLLIAAGIWLLA
jgi:predicted metal-binding membrane protein